MKLVVNIPDHADIAAVEIGIRIGKPTCSHYAVKRRALTWEEVERLREEGYVETTIYVEPDCEKYSTEELLELLKKRGVKFRG